jgi:hypothetical protein
MNTLRRLALGLAVIIVAGMGIMSTPGLAKTDPHKWYDPHGPQFGDPEDNSGGRSQRIDWTAIKFLAFRSWTGNVVVIDLSKVFAALHRATRDI